LAAREGFGRGEKWVALNVYSPGSIGAAEQTCERYGIELACPFLHRKIADLGFEIPSRTLCGGRHPKHLLRLCAALALETPPPWPLQKVLHNAAVDNDPDQIRVLGPVENWRLAEAGVLTLRQAKRMSYAVGSGIFTPAWSRLALAERYLRLYSL
jgi:hypothetical protein